MQHFRKIFFSFFLGAFLLGSNYCIAQKTTIKISADRTEILIGEQFTAKVKIEFASANNVVKAFTLPDSIEHFELIQKGKLTTTNNDNELKVVQQDFTFTSFDSGKWILPAFEIIYTNSTGKQFNELTDSLPITVSFSVADSSKLMKDIKPIRETDAAITLWYWVAGIALLILVSVLLFWYLYQRKKNSRNHLSIQMLAPYEEAIKDLENLQQFNLLEKTAVLEYHSRLKMILKKYLSRKQGISFYEKTTGDILIWLKDNTVDKNLCTEIATSLRCSDAVLFAKYLPEENDSISCLLSTKKIIIEMEKIKQQAV